MAWHTNSHPQGHHHPHHAHHPHPNNQIQPYNSQPLLPQPPQSQPLFHHHPQRPPPQPPHSSPPPPPPSNPQWCNITTYTGNHHQPIITQQQMLIIQHDNMYSHLITHEEIRNHLQSIKSNISRLGHRTQVTTEAQEALSGEIQALRIDMNTMGGSIERMEQMLAAVMSSRTSGTEDTPKTTTLVSVSVGPDAAADEQQQTVEIGVQTDEPNETKIEEDEDQDPETDIEEAIPLDENEDASNLILLLPQDGLRIHSLHHRFVGILMLTKGHRPPPEEIDHSRTSRYLIIPPTNGPYVQSLHIANVGILMLAKGHPPRQLALSNGDSSLNSRGLTSWSWSKQLDVSDEVAETVDQLVTTVGYCVPNPETDVESDEEDHVLEIAQEQKKRKRKKKKNRRKKAKNKVDNSSAVVESDADQQKSEGNTPNSNEQSKEEEAEKQEGAETSDDEKTIDEEDEVGTPDFFDALETLEGVPSTSTTTSEATCPASTSSTAQLTTITLTTELAIPAPLRAPYFQKVASLAKYIPFLKRSIHRFTSKNCGHLEATMSMLHLLSILYSRLVVSLSELYNAEAVLQVMAASRQFHPKTSEEEEKLTTEDGLTTADDDDALDVDLAKIVEYKTNLLSSGVYNAVLVHGIDQLDAMIIDLRRLRILMLHAEGGPKRGDALFRFLALKRVYNVMVEQQQIVRQLAGETITGEEHYKHNIWIDETLRVSVRKMFQDLLNRYGSVKVEWTPEKTEKTIYQRAINRVDYIEQVSVVTAKMTAVVQRAAAEAEAGTEGGGGGGSTAEDNTIETLAKILEQFGSTKMNRAPAEGSAEVQQAKEKEENLDNAPAAIEDNKENLEKSIAESDLVVCTLQLRRLQIRYLETLRQMLIGSTKPDTNEQITELLKIYHVLNQEETMVTVTRQQLEEYEAFLRKLEEEGYLVVAGTSGEGGSKG